MTRPHVDVFAGSVGIFEFGQISIIFEKEEMAKIQSANHANIITCRGAGANVDNMKYLMLVKDVGESAP